MLESNLFAECAWRRFKANERHVRRIYEKNVMIFMVSGILRFYENGELIELKKGEYYIQKKGLFQDGCVECDTPEYFFIHFYGDCSIIERFLSIRGIFQYENFIALFECLNSENTSYLKKQSVFFDILDEVSKPYQETNSLPKKILSYIDNNYLSDISMNKLSDNFSYTSKYIEKIFKDRFGLTIHKYITKRRIEQAQFIMMTSECTIENVAYECGYNEFSTFYRNFIAQVGLSPYQWRKKQRMKC